MRKYVALGAVAALGLFPSAALAGGKKYEGDFSGTGALSFKVEKRDEGKKIVRFKFRDLIVSCDSGPRMTAGRLTFAVSVNNNKFSTQAVVGNPNDPKSKLTLKGELKQNDKADGTLRVFGKKVNVGNDERDECESGTVNWDARR